MCMLVCVCACVCVRVCVCVCVCVKEKERCITIKCEITMTSDFCEQASLMVHTKYC